MQLAEKIENIVLNYDVYSGKFLKIRNKKGEIVLFVRNWAQRELGETIQRQIEKGIPPRIIILKARQLGLSTETEAKIFHRTSTQHNRRAVIVAQDKDASSNLFEMFKTFYDELPKPLQPQLKKNNEKKLEFGKLKSQIKVLTAENREKLGRSATAQDMHLSECAFWADADAAMLALLQIVPDEINTLVIAESTANGVGGWFYDTYQAAVNGENDWIPLFFAWFENPDYRKDFGSDEEKNQFAFSLDDYEIYLRDVLKLDLEQIKWYRHTLRNKAKGNRKYMMQEYPTTPEEAFQATGSNVFDTKVCQKRILSATKPKRGKLAYVENDVKLIEGAGDWLIWDTPAVKEDEHNVFASGWDIAEGVEGGDYTAGYYYDRRTAKIIMAYHGAIDPDLTANEQLKAQKFLHGEVATNTERNNHGYTVVKRAAEIGVTQKFERTYREGMAKDEEKLGTRTDVASKPIMIDRLAEFIRQDVLEAQDIEFWKEASVYIEEKGKMGAMKGRHDDRVMAMALTLNCNDWMPAYTKDRKPEPVRVHVEERNEVLF